MTRRSIALLTLCVAMTGCSSEQPAPSAAPAPAPAAPSAPIGSAGTLYVTNEISGDLSVVDVANQKVIATIQLGKRPRGLRLESGRVAALRRIERLPDCGPGRR